VLANEFVAWGPSDFEWLVLGWHRGERAAKQSMKHQNGLGKVAQITMAFPTDQNFGESDVSRGCSEAPASFS
jgi:hypothetical protein